ncbi:MAG: ferredoxin [Solirubrobacteraceae bacterium]
MSFRIEVDPISCEAHGLCAELLPERITLDEWGYPLIDREPLEPRLEALARRAADSCPTLALRLALNERATVGAPDAVRRKSGPPRADRGSQSVAGSERPSYHVYGKRHRRG